MAFSETEKAWEKTGREIRERERERIRTHLYTNTRHSVDGHTHMHTTLTHVYTTRER